MLCGASVVGDWTLEEGGDGWMDVDSLVFLSAGWASFGGRPGPLFTPAVGESACAIAL